VRWSESSVRRLFYNEYVSSESWWIFPGGGHSLATRSTRTSRYPARCRTPGATGLAPTAFAQAKELVPDVGVLVFAIRGVRPGRSVCSDDPQARLRMGREAYVRNRRRGRMPYSPPSGHG
jgi:hypothetical protein